MKRPLQIFLVFLVIGSCGYAQTSKPVYVIVHGAWGGGWAFKKVDSLMREAGCIVYRPTLTGQGEKVHLATVNVGLNTHINDVVNLVLFEDLQDVILIGHSYGGMVVTGVADSLPGRIKKLIYLDAMVPENGESVLGIQGAGAARLKQMNVNGFVIPPWVAAGKLPPKDVPHPFKTLTDTIVLKNKGREKISTKYILTVAKGAEVREDDFFSQSERAKKKGWPVVLFEADHNPQWSAPEALVEMLVKEGKGGLDLPTPGENLKIKLPYNALIDMIWINPGTFAMGSPTSEAGRKADESPQTNVTITKGYWLGKTELTIGQWKAVTGESLREHVIKMLNDETVYDFAGQHKKLREFMNFSKDEPDKILANENDSLPMYFVSWDDAMEFCKKLTAQEKANGHITEGYEYILPAEAQWEYACRAGTTSSIFAGDLIIRDKKSAALDSIAWYSGNSYINYIGRRLGNSNAGPRNGGGKKANTWGLQDMPGNIWEWCRDWYGTYPGGNVTDYTGSATGTSRVNRGGSWGSGVTDSRSANRAGNPPSEKSAYRGFRIALVRAE